MRKSFRILLAFLLLVGLLSGCGASEDTGASPSGSTEVEDASSAETSPDDTASLLFETLFPEMPVQLGMAAADYPEETSEPFEFQTGDLCRCLTVLDGVAADVAELYFFEDDGLSFIQMYGIALSQDELTGICGEPAYINESDPTALVLWLTDGNLLTYSPESQALNLYTEDCAGKMFPELLSTAKNGRVLLPSGFKGLYWYQDAGSMKYGLYSEEEDVVLTDACYDDYGAFDPEGMAPAQQDGYWGYVNASGETIIGHYFENAESFSGNCAVVGNTGNWGTIDRTGNYVVQPEYREVRIEADSPYILVRNEADHWGAYDQFGNMLIQASTNIKDERYDKIVVCNGLLYAQTSERWYHVFDENGGRLLREAKAVSFPKNGFHIVRLEGPVYTFADECLNVIGRKAYDDLTDFSASGYAIGYLGNHIGRGGQETWEVIDTQGNVVHTLSRLNDCSTTYEYANDYIVCAYYSMGTGQNSVKHGVLDLQTRQFTKYAEVKPVNGTQCIIVTADSGRMGLYVRDELVLDCVYDEIRFDGSVFHLERGAESTTYQPA